MIVPVVLAGGIGARLWPVSHMNHPKQFLSLINENSLLQNTLQLTLSLASITSPIIICNAAHRFIAAEQAQKIVKSSTILLESSSHGTAPAVLLAALYAITQYDDPILLIQPSDSYINDNHYFSTLVQLSLPAATEGNLVTFGVKTTEAHSGYGYIKPGKALLNMPGFVVDEFVEKPDPDTAEVYHRSGKYYWNSGMFLFKASAIIKEAEKYAPDLIKICEEIMRTAKFDPDFIRFDMSAFDPSWNVSIDHAIMQKTQKAVVLPFLSAWADIGDWNKVWQVAEKDKENNAIKGEVVAVDTKGCYIHSNSHLIVAIGVKNLVIIETPEGLLVADIREGQRIKSIVNQLIHKDPGN